MGICLTTELLKPSFKYKIHEEITLLNIFNKQDQLSIKNDWQNVQRSPENICSFWVCDNKFLTAYFSKYLILNT